MRTKFYFVAALAATMLASCADDKFVGDNSPNVVQNERGENAILFGSMASHITRNTSNSGSYSDMLDGQMKIVGVKKVNSGPTYTTVFNDYVVWSNTTNATTSNPDATTDPTAENGWEYVGASSQSYGNSATAGTLGKEQYIKYWDYDTDEYHFVAGSPVKDFTYTITSGEIASATITGITGHINPNTGTAMSKDPVYIADPVKKLKASSEYKTDVVFRFTRQQTYVRVGVYETVPGYKITEIDFYEWDKDKTPSADWNATPRSEHYIVLNSKTAGYFKGSTGSTKATVTYEWTTPSVSGIDYESTTNQVSWYGGKLNLSSSNPLATSSTEATKTYFYGTDSDIDENGYFVVLPTRTDETPQPIIVKCDYKLTALDGSETIYVKGATAAIPAAFSKWNRNTTYTYLFKISDNTNGTTGTVGTDPVGLYPITFDAVVIAETDGTQQGYITTVSTPSITTYQDASVVANGVQYVANTAIKFTAQDDKTGDLKTLAALNNGTPAAGMVQVYSVADGTTEADLILTRPTTTVTTTIGSAAWEINGQSVTANQWASFTPTSAGTYAIEYITETTPNLAYAYKVVTVVASH